MNKILIISLFVLAFCDTVSDDYKGPSYNLKHPTSTEFCLTYNPWDQTENKWYDEADGNKEIAGVSDCVDNLLWDKNAKRYYDRCCFLRFQLDGVMHSSCVSLTEEQYLDISETIRKMENGDKNIWKTTKGSGCKIYQLDCDSSYLTTMFISFVLLSLLL